MRIVTRSISDVRLHILWVLVALPSMLQAQNAALSLESKEVLPGADVEIALLARLDRTIRGFQVGIEFPAYAMDLKAVSLENTELAGRTPDVFLRDIAHGYATVKVLVDNAAPLENPIPSGTGIRLARFVFHVAQGFGPGTEFPLTLKSNLGSPAVPALIHVDARTVPPASLGGGALKIVDRNVLRIRDLTSVRPNTVETLEMSAFNVSPLQGFSIGVKYDPALVKFLDVDLTDTITEAVGAEYVAPIIDNVRGYFLLGVLLDSVPPFEGQVIPAAGLDLTIAKARIQVLSAPAGTRSVELELADGLGAPPIRNLFVIDNQSIAPVKQNGRLNLLVDGPFIRGDVNGDGQLDISDPIATADWIFRQARTLRCHKAADSNDDGKADLQDMVYTLLFLFHGGPILPAPYPVSGLDPTPDNLPCPP